MYNVLQRCLISAVVVWAMVLLAGCGEDSSTGPTTGTVSGTVTFIGAPPEEEGIVHVALFAVWPPMGPPEHFIELSDREGTVAYTLPGVSFGTYAAVAVGWRVTGQMDQILGAAGFRPPEDMQAEAIAVSQDDPDRTGVDIVADYAMLSEGGPPE